MDYNWLTSGCDHDPMAIDANLAEIDFDDFKNEDIQNAYAFSLQSYVSISMDGLLKKEPEFLSLGLHLLASYIALGFFLAITHLGK